MSIRFQLAPKDYKVKIMGKPNFIYVGPNIAPIGLRTNMLFRGGEPPAKLLEIMQAKPVVGSLFISTRNLAAAKKKLTEKGSLEYTAYKEMLAIAKTIPR